MLAAVACWRAGGAASGGARSGAYRLAVLARLGDEQVVDLLKMNLHKLHAHLVLVVAVLGHLVEQVADHPVSHALVRRSQVRDLADRVRLARAGLAVGEDSAVVAEHHRVDKWPPHHLEELLIVLAVAKD